MQSNRKRDNVISVPKKSSRPDSDEIILERAVLTPRLRGDPKDRLEQINPVIKIMEKSVFRILKRLRQQRNLRKKEINWTIEFQPNNKKEKLRLSTELMVFEGLIDWIIEEFAEEE